MGPTGELTAHDTWLVACAASAIVGLVVLVAVAKVHPLLALLFASAWVGLGAGASPAKTLSAFQKGAGETLGGVGLVVALGTMLGKVFAESGAAERLVSAILERAGTRRLPWAMAAAAMLVGIPMFFEVGLVLLMPIILLASRKAGVSPARVGFPALAALSVCHGLIPPHPGPLVAMSALHADLGATLGFGLLVALPTAVLAGPVFGGWVARRLDLPEPAALAAQIAPDAQSGPLPGLALSACAMVLPLVVMIAGTFAKLAGLSGRAADMAVTLGQPIPALLVSVVFAVSTLGRARRLRAETLSRQLGDSLAPIAAMVMIIGAGGGFKQTLVESGVGEALGKAAAGSSFHGLVLGWLLAVAIRLATGSATVATVTASGLMASLVHGSRPVSAPLLALSVGCGSLFFSHVNDAGFWLVKEYFGMTVGQTLRSWSVLETVISVVGLACILLLSWMQ